MYCQRCGRQIADQAKFCNYCGYQVAAAQPQPQPQYQPQPQPQPQYRPQPQPQPKPQPQPQPQPQPKPQPQTQKPASGGKTLLGAIIVGVVVVSVMALVSSLRAEFFPAYKRNQPSNSGTGVIELKNADPTSTCLYGALYQNGYLTYGHARVRIPDYTRAPGSGSEPDVLLAPDGSSLFRAGTRLEVNLSYDSSDADEILQSYENTLFSNARMTDFRKYQVGGYHVIRYIMQATVNGEDEYVGELIVFPSKNPTKTMRLCMEALGANGYNVIDQVFSTLEISSAYELSASDTGVMGEGRITVK